MCTSQRVICEDPVIESYVGPIRGGVAGFARGRESCRDVVWIRGRCEVLLVTAIAIRGERRVVAVDVALCAGDCGVCACKWKSGCVIERRGCPGRRGVAHRTIRWEPGGDVIRIRRTVEVLCVAGVARGRRAFVHVIHVTRSARQVCMSASKRVPRDLQMVELGIEPRVHCVAALTRGGEVAGNVIDDGCVKVLLMTGETSGGKAGKLAGCCVLMAVVALQERMRANQRKAVLVIADVVERRLPATDRVAALAV